jgi:hypothetical protein
MSVKNETLLFEIPELDTPKKNPKVLRILISKDLIQEIKRIKY